MNRAEAEIRGKGERCTYDILAAIETAWGPNVALAYAEGALESIASYMIRAHGPQQCFEKLTRTADGVGKVFLGEG